MAAGLTSLSLAPCGKAHERLTPSLTLSYQKETSYVEAGGNAGWQCRAAGYVTEQPRCPDSTATPRPSPSVPITPMALPEPFSSQNQVSVLGTTACCATHFVLGR